MYKILIFTIISLLFSSCATKEITQISKPPVEKIKTNLKKALLIGVSDYSPESTDLPGIDMDISRVKTLLISWGFEVETLYNEESIGLEDYLKKYKKSLNESDSFVFYYSGHGSHTNDTNGDEDDGQDETIVLSDGSENMHFLDDDLYYYFSHIKAKKLILFDSCHSGTAFKDPSNKFVSKGIFSNLVGKIISQGRKGEDKIEGEYVVLSAAQDDEESIASTAGSFFTHTLVTLLSEPDSEKKSFEAIRETVTYEIVTACEKEDLNAHHPKLSVSNPSLKNVSVEEYLGL